MSIRFFLYTRRNIIFDAWSMGLFVHELCALRCVQRGTALAARTLADSAMRTSRVGDACAIVAFELAPANVHELAVAEHMPEGAGVHALGDRNYWSPNFVRTTCGARVEAVGSLSFGEVREEAMASLAGADASTH